MPLTPEELATEFPLEPGLAYLNHAGVSPWPRSAMQALAQFANENVHRGAERYPDWMRVEALLRESLAHLINAPSPACIALLKNTSEGLSFVANGLDWQSGDELVIPAQEFPSNRIPWLALEPKGIRVVEVAILDSQDPEADLMAACTEKTRLMSVSGSHYINGLSLDLNRLGEYCKRQGIFFVVDAIQTVGVRPFDVTANACDVAIADAHKWLLGPEGIALFYVRPEAMEHLRVSEYGWHMLESAGNYDRLEWALAADARRYECGSPNLLGSHALLASVQLMLRHGLPSVFEDIAKRVSYLSDHIQEIAELQVLTPEPPGRRAGIVNVRLRSGNTARVADALRRARVCIAVRGGGLRFSPHFYTPYPVLDYALAQLRTAISQG